MSTQGEQSGTIVGQDEALSAEQEAMIKAFVGMVRRGEVPIDQGGLGASLGDKVDNITAQDPLEAENDNEVENGSLRVELSHHQYVAKHISSLLFAYLALHNCNDL